MALREKLTGAGCVLGLAGAFALGSFFEYSQRAIETYMFINQSPESSGETSGEDTQNRAEEVFGKDYKSHGKRSRFEKKVDDVDIFQRNGDYFIRVRCDGTSYNTGIISSKDDPEKKFFFFEY